jgi:U3 small nucleolar RNA-associated protein 12
MMVLELMFFVMLQSAMWHETGLRSLVTSITRSPIDWTLFAVGYADGSIRLWSSTTNSVVVTFNGHKSAISILAFDSDGTRLASGSKDTDIIVWDVVGEVGMFRLRGHRDMITGLAFIASPDTTEAKGRSTHLLTASKDTFIKLFDLGTQHCIETVVGHRGEAWSFAYDSKSGVLISGGGEGEVKCWKVDAETLQSGVQSSVGENGKGKLRRAISPIAALTLSTQSHTHNITQITLHPTLPVLAIHSGEKTIDVFRLRTEEELRKKLARRRRREREKKKEGSSKGKGKEVAGEDEDEDDEEVGTGGDAEPEWRDRLAVWSVIRAGGKIKSFSFAPETLKSKGDVQVSPFLLLFSPLTYQFIAHPDNDRVNK